MYKIAWSEEVSLEATKPRQDQDQDQDQEEPIRSGCSALRLQPPPSWRKNNKSLVLSMDRIQLVHVRVGGAERAARGEAPSAEVRA